MRDNFLGSNSTMTSSGATPPPPATTPPTTSLNAGTPPTSLFGLPIPDPTPDFDAAIDQLGVAWTAHRWAGVAAFAFVGLMALFSVIRLCFSHPFAGRICLVFSHLFLLLLSAARSASLYIDAYNAENRFPAWLHDAVVAAALPCGAGAFHLLFVVLLVAAKTSLLHGLKHPATVMTVTTFHFLVTMSCVVIAAIFKTFHFLQWAAQGFYVLWSMILTLIFLASHHVIKRAFVVVAAKNRAKQYERDRSCSCCVSPALDVAVVAALAQILMGATQVFGMLFVYGVLNRAPPSPFLWWCFHSVMRSLEVVFIIFVVVAANLLLRHRPKNPYPGCCGFCCATCRGMQRHDVVDTPRRSHHSSPFSYDSTPTSGLGHKLRHHRDFSRASPTPSEEDDRCATMETHCATTIDYTTSRCATPGSTASATKSVTKSLLVVQDGFIRLDLDGESGEGNSCSTPDENELPEVDQDRARFHHVAPRFRVDNAGFEPGFPTGAIFKKDAGLGHGRLGIEEEEEEEEMRKKSEKMMMTSLDGGGPLVDRFGLDSEADLRSIKSEATWTFRPPSCSISDSIERELNKQGLLTLSGENRGLGLAIPQRGSCSRVGVGARSRKSLLGQQLEGPFDAESGLESGYLNHRLSRSLEDFHPFLTTPAPTHATIAESSQESSPTPSVPVAPTPKPRSAPTPLNTPLSPSPPLIPISTPLQDFSHVRTFKDYQEAVAAKQRMMKMAKSQENGRLSLVQ